MTKSGDMKRFEFFAPTRIVFGEGTFKEIATEAVSMGKRPFVVTGGPEHNAELLSELLGKAGLETVIFRVRGEPTVSLVNECIEKGRMERCDMVIALGGGSVLDTGKATALMLTNEGELNDYLEVIGRGRKPVNPAVPMIAVPTTAGTGAEVTRNAVICSLQHRLKVSLRSPFLFPKASVIDPELTYSLPPHITASTGLDALTQCIEAYVSIKATPFTDSLSLEGIVRAAGVLKIACTNGNDSSARKDMALASLLSGLALANSGLGAVHGLAAAVGGASSAPHGVVCAMLLPAVTKANINSLLKKQRDSYALERYSRIAKLISGNPDASAADCPAAMADFCSKLPLNYSDTVRIDKNDFSSIASDALRASSMKGNPVELTHEELVSVLEEAFGA